MASHLEDTAQMLPSSSWAHLYARLYKALVRPENPVIYNQELAMENWWNIFSSQFDPWEMANMDYFGMDEQLGGEGNAIIDGYNNL